MTRHEHGTPPSSAPPVARGRQDGAPPAGETPALRHTPAEMNCDREAEVWRAIDARHWPERCDEELRAHVASCADCADLVEVASALSEEHDAVMREAHVPASGAVWWRTQMRVRQEAARTARRAMSIIQAAVVVAALGIVAAIGGFAWVPGVLASAHWSLPLILVLATPLALAPVAVYFAVTED